MISKVFLLYGQKNAMTTITINLNSIMQWFLVNSVSGLHTICKSISTIRRVQQTYVFCFPLWAMRSKMHIYHLHLGTHSQNHQIFRQICITGYSTKYYLMQKSEFTTGIALIRLYWRSCRVHSEFAMCTKGDTHHNVHNARFSKPANNGQFIDNSLFSDANSEICTNLGKGQGKMTLSFVLTQLQCENPTVA